MISITPLPGAAEWFMENQDNIFSWTGAGHDGEAWQRLRDEAAARIIHRLELRRDPEADGGRVMERSRFTDEMGEFTDLAGVPVRKSADFLWVIWDLSVGLAHGFCGWRSSISPATLEAFPYQTLIDSTRDGLPAEMVRRWRAAGGSIRKGAAIARVDDPVWEKLSDFGLPFPPFRIGCMVDLQSLCEEDAVELGFRASP